MLIHGTADNKISIEHSERLFDTALGDTNFCERGISVDLEEPCLKSKCKYSVQLQRVVGGSHNNIYTYHNWTTSLKSFVRFVEMA
jgi:hypothetical protein